MVKFPTVVAAVEGFVSSSEVPLVSAVEAGSGLIDSCVSVKDTDIPPEYTAAATFPVSVGMGYVPAFPVM